MSKPTQASALAHFLTLEGLSHETLLGLIEHTLAIHSGARQPQWPQLTLANLFFEPSTRTRSTFELAAKRLGGTVLNLDVGTSSTSKGEDLLDTVRTLAAAGCNLFAVRHQQTGVADWLAQHAPTGVGLLNAGDGAHAHPTQGLLDLATIAKHKADFGALRVVIVGDIRHSRVARSLIHGLNRLHTGQVCVCGPDTLLPQHPQALGVHCDNQLDRALEGADVVVMLRLQRERMKGLYLSDLDEYHRCYGLTQERLAKAKEQAIVMHPGPMNRGVEIASEVADGPQSVILEQVAIGVAARMAVMDQLMQTHQPEGESGA
jgi:aspartate carbamoyltransferase catalytic subunit